MAISRWLFGEGRHTLSLLLFSGLSIAGGALLAKELFASDRAATLAAFFLAINPALVFFSKFPVTEVVAFAFTVNGFLFLLRAVGSDHSGERRFFCLASFLCFTSFLFVRIQFFMFVPFFGLLLAAAILGPDNTFARRRLIVTFVTALFLAFAVSLLFYFLFQRRLFDAIVLGRVGSLLTAPAGIGGAVGLLLLGTVTALLKWTGSARIDAFNRWTRSGLQLAPWLLACTLLASVPSVVSLYRGDVLSPVRFSVPIGDDRWLIRYHAVYRLSLMLSPVGVLLLLAAPMVKTKWNTSVLLGFVFLATVWFAILLQPDVLYLYYYGRYLVGEAVPYALILVAGLLAHMWSNGWPATARLLTAVICGYFLVFSAAQYNKHESEDTRFYPAIQGSVSGRDVLIATGVDDRQVVPLRLYYGLRVFPLTDGRGQPFPLNQEALQELRTLVRHEGGALYLLTPRRLEGRGTVFLHEAQFRESFLTNGEHFRGGVLQRASGASRLMLPVEQDSLSQSFRLYRLDDDVSDSLFNFHCVEELDLSIAGAVYVHGLYGFSGAEDHGRWTDGRRAGYSCRLPNGFKARRLRLEVAMAYTPGTYRQAVTVSTNGSVPVERVYSADEAPREIDIPLVNQTEETLTIDLALQDPISPKQLEGSRDDRQLGISIRRIRID
jgi:hypothetical protein